MQDYESLKQQNMALRKEVNTLHDKLRETIVEHEKNQSDQRELIRELTSQLSKPSSEVLQLRVEVRELRDAARKDQLVTAHEKQQLMSRLQTEANANRELRHQLSEYQLQERGLKQELSDLQLLQDQTHAALSAEFQRSRRNPNSLLKSLGVANRSIRDDRERLETSRSQASKHTSLPSGTGQHATCFKHLDQSCSLRRNVSSSSTDDLDVPPVESLAFIEQTKKTFERLENEAAELERSYQVFQQRLTQGTLPTIPSTAELQHSASLLLKAPKHTVEKDHFPKVERLFVQRQIGSEMTPSIQTLHRPVETVRSGSQHLDWITGLEMKTSVTGVRSASYNGENMKKPNNSQTDHLAFRKQPGELPVSDVGGHLKTTSVRPITVLPASISQIKSNMSNPDVIDSEVVVASAISLSTEQHEPESHLEQVQSTMSETSDVLQLDITAVPKQQLVADSNDVLTDRHQDIKQPEDHQTSPNATHSVSLDGAWRQSKVPSLKQTAIDDVAVPSLETAWRSNQTMTSNQSMNNTVAPQKKETINPNEDNMPTVAGISSTSQGGHDPIVQEDASREETSNGMTLKGIGVVEVEEQEEDDWEKKRRQRNEERRQREEARRQKEQEELERLQVEDVSTRSLFYE
jgi:hypothetical protein